MIVFILLIIQINPKLFDKVCQWLVAGQWFSPGTPVSSTNKTNSHDITEILLKVTLNTENQTNKFFFFINAVKLSNLPLFLLPHKPIWVISH